MDFRFHKLLDLQESGFNAQNQTSLELQPGRKAQDSQILGQRWSKRHLHLPLFFELKGWDGKKIEATAREVDCIVALWEASENTANLESLSTVSDVQK